jgi:hypothetical protein
VSPTQTFHCLNCGTRIGAFSHFCSKACSAAALKRRAPEKGAVERSGASPRAFMLKFETWLRGAEALRDEGKNR